MICTGKESKTNITMHIYYKKYNILNTPYFGHLQKIYTISIMFFIIIRGIRILRLIADVTMQKKKKD